MDLSKMYAGDSKGLKWRTDDELHEMYATIAKHTQWSASDIDHELDRRAHELDRRSNGKLSKAIMWAAVASAFAAFISAGIAVAVYLKDPEVKVVVVPLPELSSTPVPTPLVLPHRGSPTTRIDSSVKVK